MDKTKVRNGALSPLLEQLLGNTRQAHNLSVLVRVVHRLQHLVRRE